MLDQTIEAAEDRVSAGAALAVSFARSSAEVLEAQRLRCRLFAEEMGARIPGVALGTDCDLYDAHCQHLLVRDTGSGEVVCTYRLLQGQKEREIGRSCVHPDYRTGTTIALLWQGLAAFAERHDYRFLIGCASLSMADGGCAAASIYRRLVRNHLSSAEYRVIPRCELPLAALRRDVDTQPPALVKGYLRAGAYICGAPARDPDFNTADLLMLPPPSRMSARYARYFLRT